jgi:hypothetical protein
MIEYLRLNIEYLKSASADQLKNTITKMTERSDFHNSSIVIRHSSFIYT